MIELNAKHKSRLYLAACRALETDTSPSSREEAQRHGLALLMSQFTDGSTDYLAGEVLTYLDAITAQLHEEEIDGAVSFRLANVAGPLGGDFAAAATTLALLGCRRVRSFNDDDDDWSNAEPGETATSVRLGSDVLVNQLRLQLEEAETFAEKMKQSEALKQRVSQKAA